jgi:hypothetical protein
VVGAGTAAALPSSARTHTSNSCSSCSASQYNLVSYKTSIYLGGWLIVAYRMCSIYRVGRYVMYHGLLEQLSLNNKVKIALQDLVHFDTLLPAEDGGGETEDSSITLANPQSTSVRIYSVLLYDICCRWACCDHVFISQHMNSFSISHILSSRTAEGLGHGCHSPDQNESADVTCRCRVRYTHPEYSLHHAGPATPPAYHNPHGAQCQ